MLSPATSSSSVCPVPLNLSDANTILNTAVAKDLKGYADELEGAEDFTSAVIALVKRTIRDHRRVIFNGNGYTAE